MKNKNQTGLKTFKPKINLNHNIYIHKSVSSHFKTSRRELKIQHPAEYFD